MRIGPTDDTACLVWAYAICLLCSSPALGQCEIAKIVAADGATGDLFGYSATMNEAGMFVGAFLADNYEQNSGAVYSVNSRGTQQEIVPPFGRGFGESVSVDGQRLLVGGTSGGYAFLLAPSEASDWTIIAQLHSNDWASGDAFGASVGLSGDIAVVGAYNESNENGGEAGSAYVFERNMDDSWAQIQKLTASDGTSGASFGDSVAIDANLAVVGAPDDSSLAFASGKAYIFEKSDLGVWSEAAVLVPSVVHSLQNYGDAVAVDDGTVMVGAQTDPAAASGAGAVFVYQRDAEGAWRHIQQLTATDAANSQFFGSAVSCQEDSALIGARGDANAGVNSGAAYLFIRESDGVWRQHAKLTASDGAAYAEFGYSVALHGSWALIGTPYDDDLGLSSGSAYIFRVGPDWSGNGVPDICECPGDIDYSGAVGLPDLSALLTNFGLAAGQSYESGDIDGDYDVDLADLSALLERYGVACP